MHAFTFVVASLALVLAASALPQDLPHNDFYSETQECIANKAFIDKCNNCYCGADGKSAICTKKACPVPEKPHIDDYQEGLSCPAGQSFFNECNACVCDESGKSAHCTLMMCQAGSRTRRSVEQDVPVVQGYKQGDACPAPYFKDNCNDCVCGPDGVSAACTYKLCSAPRARRSVQYYPRNDNFADSGECTPGQTFYDNCNTCRCNADGKSAACTLVLCPTTDKIRIDNYVQGNKCPAGKTFYDKCNACKCGANGQSALCTLAACPDFE